MEAWTHIEGVAAPLLRPNIDTDIIIPSREITSPERTGYADKLFAPWRYRGPDRSENADFVLNREPFRAAQILIAGENFGCGSSREMAVWALRQFGIRCIVAPSFGAIFRDNCIRNSVLPVHLPAALVHRLGTTAETSPAGWVVDLMACELVEPDGCHHAFTLDAREREILLSGLDAIDLTWQRRAQIELFERTDRLHRPWIWDCGGRRTAGPP